MTTRPSNSGSSENLDAHARRLEGRKLIQACMDREISADSPQLRSALSRDTRLREEFDDMCRLDALLQSPAPATDLSSRILADLQNRPVFLPSSAPRRSAFAGFGIGLAASLALGAGTIWVTLAALRSPAPLQSIAQADVLGEAREAIRNITGTSLAHAMPQRPYVIEPASESSQVPDIDSIAMAHDPNPRLLANQMAGNGAVRIERTGLSVVNPGPARTPNPSGRASAALLEWNTQPNAIYSGGKSRRSDVYRATAVTGWYDREGTFVPVTGAGTPK